MCVDFDIKVVLTHRLLRMKFRTVPRIDGTKVCFMQQRPYLGLAIIKACYRFCTIYPCHE